MTSPEGRTTGSLTIVGAGIKPGRHLTQEARVHIERADKVLYLLAEPPTSDWIEGMNPSAESLAPLYEPGRPHAEVYEALVTAMLDRVRRGEHVCVVTYGNPAVFDQSSHETVRRAREEGFTAKILPGISALDCLFVDLGIDPGQDGFQCFEASEFLRLGKVPDPTVPLVLWQISVIGETVTTGTVNWDGLTTLATALAQRYGPDHEVVVYEANPFPIGQPLIERCAVRDLASASVTGMSTLYVPPAVVAEP